MFLSLKSQSHYDIPSHPQFNLSFHKYKQFCHTKCNKPKMSHDNNLYSRYFTKFYFRNHKIQHRQNIVNTILLLRFLHSLHIHTKHQAFILYPPKHKIITIMFIQNNITNKYSLPEFISFIPFSSKNKIITVMFFQNNITNKYFALEFISPISSLL